MSNKNYEFHALGSYKEELFKLLLNHELSDYLMDILMPTIQDERFDKVDNFLGGCFEYYDDNGNMTLVDINEHLYDVPFVYSTVLDERNVICIDTYLRSCTQTLKEMVIEMSVICHKDSMKLDLDTRMKYKELGYIGRNRLDIAVAIIGDIVNGSSDFGIGKLVPSPLNPIKPYYYNQEFFGKILTYNCSDFMKDYRTLK